MPRYNVTVRSNLYAKYYFELRALFKDNEKEFPLKALDKGDAEKLEVRSKDYKNIFADAKPKANAGKSFASFGSKPTWD
jgi:hypothetical protein